MSLLLQIVENLGLDEVNTDPSILSIYGVAMGVSTVSVAVGSMEGIYLTSDGGTTWEMRSFCPVHDFTNNSTFRSRVSGSWYFNQNALVVYGIAGFVGDGRYAIKR